MDSPVRLKKRAGSAAVIAVLAAFLLTGTASADPNNKNSSNVAAICDNGFTGTLVGISFSSVAASLLASDGTSAFVNVRFTLFTADNELLFDYQKSGERSGQTFTTCSVDIPDLGLHGTLVGRFTPVS